ncbi:6-phosphogluconolactonase [Flavobacterium sp. F-328]|jgi:6-phosphogluconolactonase|uniref:6-phosphogluconolactonase n=3 Tax=Flavobacteriales TaxID=200644 RepID=A0A9Q3YSW9_9FLAO|nr:MULTISPECIES: 6-phosphogluconolactonase [Flavobacteriales]MBD3904728.1 6-phosphogluconolactonase [Chryseobacterium muglaense]MBQ0907398.1 6-phosphogluconolactonase [Flavobacterium erciyesense]MCC9036234.1 6-phosphogluconolactonase [Chryseobacterium muglaense]MCC9070618.1 6-phosphogluconolactonase [Flavobacterium sp. F-65]MCM2554887.1 6-phosphogluconolactonase [Chryseobacterium muglaense]
MLNIQSSTEEIFKTTAQLFVAAANDAIDQKGFFTVALTGGSSPEGLYKLLSEDQYKNQIDWTKVLVFWGDERWVSLDNGLSNAKMSQETLLQNVPVLPSNIFPMYADDVKPEDFASTYNTLLHEKLGDDGIMDFILLGMGSDGHTASLFPGTAVLDEKEKWVAAYYLDAQQMYRITLTAPFLNKAKKIIVLTFGDAKADALKEVLEGDYNPSLYPSQLLKPTKGELLFLVDEKAAKYLSNND